MVNSDMPSQEMDRLFQILNAENVDPDELEAGFKEFSAASKNELVARVARTFQPAPTGKLLARLIFIRTDKNGVDMQTAFIANLRAPDPEARKFSLYGLKSLDHPALEDFALLSLRDNNDQVIYAACYILLSRVKHNANLRHLLQGVYTAHRGQKEFHMSSGLLEGHGIAHTN